MSDHAEQSNGVESSQPSTSSLPNIAAAFLVKFDDRKGYTLAWQKSISSLDVEGVVEFKSMPSGLHNVTEDLVYFVYEDYAGVSAVLNIEDEAAARKARIIAVGVLIPLEHGRMGKSWLHAKILKELAETQIHKDNDDFSALEEFWNEHHVSDEPVSQSPRANSALSKSDLSLDTNLDIKTDGYRKNRSMSTATALLSTGYTLPAHHPALVISDFLHMFGPLIFPLVRAALLRKRILFLGEAPVEKTCNYVYNLSVLSTLPKPIATLLPDLDPAQIRLRLLLNIGIADMSMLESEAKSSSGWIACTTDDVLCTKPDLFDILVILPGVTSRNTGPRAYPKIYLSDPGLSKARPQHGIRATQRDVKRFATLWKGLQFIPRSKQEKDLSDSSAIISSPEESPDTQPQADADETASLASSVSSTMSLKSVVEPQSWSRIAYTGLVWWATAGDKRGGLTEIEEIENDQDVALLSGESLGEVDGGADEEARSREIACVQYFQRLSNMMFTAVGEAVRRIDGYENRYRDDETERSRRDQDDGDHQTPLLDQTGQNSDGRRDGVEITEVDIQSMGLDAWSVSDRQFIEELVKFWWNRKANVQGGRIECCGVRIL